MSDRKDEPAFPGKHTEWIEVEQGWNQGQKTWRSEEKEVYHSGLTKREWFAGMALQGHLAWCGMLHDNKGDLKENERAKLAFQHADAMIDESKK